jgi:hypothetical protein
MNAHCQKRCGRRGKHIDRYVSAVLIALSTSCLAQQLKNPSFEAPSDKKKVYDDKAAEWGRWGAYLNRESTWDSPHNGKCLLGYHHWVISDNESSGVYQDVEGADPNVKYTFSVHAFVDKDTNADRIELRLEKLWGNGEIVSKKYYLGSLDRGSWKRLTVEGTPTEKGLRVVIVCVPGQDKARTGAIKFDDARLQR